MSKFWAGEAELWAVVDVGTGHILWSRGGSSTAKKLMVYASESSARRALSSRWIKEILTDRPIEIRKVYEAKP